VGSVDEVLEVEGFFPAGKDVYGLSSLTGIAKKTSVLQLKGLLEVVHFVQDVDGMIQTPCRDESNLRPAGGFDDRRVSTCHVSLVPTMSNFKHRTPLEGTPVSFASRISWQDIVLSSHDTVSEATRRAGCLFSLAARVIDSSRQR
jgi:hypothetical protein